MNISKNEKVRIGDSQFSGAATATLDFAKDKRGDYILAGDEVIADAGDGIDTYEVLKVLPGNKVKLGGLGVEVATVDAKTVSVARKHGILKRDGDTVVLKNSALNAKFKVGDKVFVDWIGGESERGVITGIENGLYKVKLVDGKISSVREGLITSANSSNPVVANAVAWKARNAKSQQRIEIDEGDMVSDLKGRWHGLKEVWEVGRDWVRVEGGMTIRDTDMLVINSAATNAETKDSKGNVLKDGDYAVPTLGSSKGKRVKIISIHSRANIYIQDASGTVKIIDGQYLVKA